MVPNSDMVTKRKDLYDRFILKKVAQRNQIYE